MLYTLLKAYARLAIRFYCTKLVVNKPEVLQRKGPLLFAANHPNSFLDGIILTTLTDHSLYSLARGDVFKHPRINRFLRSIRLLPVYRTSEGVENLEHNYTTFASCQEAFREGKMVLIFSEGRCENEWHLRPLKKGTARLVTSSWQQGIPLTVIPVGFNYSSFHRFGKSIHLLFGEPIVQEHIDMQASEGKQWQQFNGMLQKQLQELVYEIGDGETVKRKKRFGIRADGSLVLLAIPALAGVLLHAPLFFLVKAFSEWRFRNSGHYDSVQTSLLMLAYPVYFIALLLLATYLWGSWGLLLLASPILAWAAIQAKYKLDI